MPTKLKRKVRNYNEKSIISNLNTNIDINWKKIKNLETDQNIKQSTGKQILTKHAKNVI